MKEFFKSVYVKASVALIISGMIIILFYNIINEPEGVGAVVNAFNRVMMPIYIGLILAFIMCPIYNKLVKGIFYRMSFAFTTDHKAFVYARAMGSFIVLVIIIVTIVTVLLTIVPQLINSIVGLIDVMPERLETFQLWAEENLGQFPQIAKSINDFANASSNTVIKWIETNILRGEGGSLAIEVSLGILNTVKGIINIFIGILLCLYLLNYKERLFAQAKKASVSIFSVARAEAIHEFVTITNKTFVGFLVGRIIDAFVIGAITYLSMRLFVLPYPVLISVLIGVTNVIPFFGPFIGAIPAFCIIFLVDPVQAFYFFVMILLIQQLDGNVIGPKVVGDAIGLSSFWVIIAILLGGGMFGFVGMFLGVPIFAIIYTYADKILKKKLRRKNMPDHTDDYLAYDKYGVNKEALFSDKKHD
ncbi:MAG TPA: AI-2E family transporter [Anaerovoracaceae bacterium]|nr:AI-2E family transporter [Anaerovoracaceae bacterium]